MKTGEGEVTFIRWHLCDQTDQTCRIVSNNIDRIIKITC